MFRIQKQKLYHHQFSFVICKIGTVPHCHFLKKYPEFVKNKFRSTYLLHYEHQLYLVCRPGRFYLCSFIHTSRFHNSSQFQDSYFTFCPQIFSQFFSVETEVYLSHQTQFLRFKKWISAIQRFKILFGFSVYGTDSSSLIQDVIPQSLWHSHCFSAGLPQLHTRDFAFLTAVNKTETDIFQILHLLPQDRYSHCNLSLALRL